MNDHAVRPEVVTAVLHAADADAAARMLPSVASLRRAHPDVRVVLGAPDPRAVTAPLDVHERRHATGLAALVSEVFRETGGHVLVLRDVALVPPGFLDNALATVASDLRVATVSFLSNAAGLLSFPHRNHAAPRPVDGNDEVSVTRLLRQRSPEVMPAPIPVAAGAAVLISAWGLSALGGMAGLPADFDRALVEFCLDARGRGFVDLLDASTFVTRPWDLAADPSGAQGEEVTAAPARHPWFAGFLAVQRSSEDSPLATALGVARAKVTGLDVLIEAGSVGPLEMGTQVQTLALVEALSRRDDVRRVGVAMANEVPGYARRVLSLPKVEPRLVPADDFSAFGHVDVVHRPYQPDRHIDVARWRRTAARTVVTLQDLIAYHVGAYHGTAQSWLAYRDGLAAAVRDVDGVVVISQDTRMHLERERLGVDPSRVAVVENGIDHLRGDEAARIPEELLARGFTAGEFLVVVGANYGHKNRDIAIRAWELLRGGGRDIALVLVGAFVPHGSSRLAEGVAAGNADGLFVIPDVSSEERNWLLRHAAAMIYPTSAEGFGLLPYEAARFGTPTVLVSFGPLREVAGDLPVTASSWSPEAIASATETLLRDPAVAERQIAQLRAVEERYSWDATAEKLVATYRELLARPAITPAAASSSDLLRALAAG